MDIKTAAADSASKATAWLTQNMPLDVTEVPAVPTPAPLAALPTTDQAPSPAIVPAQAAPAVPAVVTPVAPAVETPKPGLAEAIRRDRDARTAASTAQADATKYKGELEALRKENASLKAQGSATDPFEFLQSRKMTKEQQAIWGQAFLYDLRPEAAPQNFRLDLYKAEQARKEAERIETAQKAAVEEAQQLERTHLDRYATDLFQHVQSTPGSNPESELWFSEDGADGTPQVNQRAYAQSLFATANNIATQAQKTGQQADLSPANIAKVLEAEVSKRMQRRDAKKAGNAKPVQAQVKPAVPAQGGTQATTTTTSAEGLRSGAPIPPDNSEEARKARAAAVLFGTK